MSVKRSWQATSPPRLPKQERRGDEMATFPRMTNGGKTVQRSENFFIATPNALDRETAWKVCDRKAPGAIAVFSDEVFVNMDRKQSIRNNLESLRSPSGGFVSHTLGRVVDAFDVARHAAMAALGR
jgi:hypothetical protein